MKVENVQSYYPLKMLCVNQLQFGEQIPEKNHFGSINLIAKDMPIDYCPNYYSFRFLQHCWDRFC